VADTLRCLRASLVGFLLLLVSAAPSWAQEEGGALDDPETRLARQRQAEGTAQQYVQIGERLFDAGDHGEAVQNFLRAERALEKVEADVPAILYRSIARCYDQLGQIPAALSYYKKFLALADPASKELARVRREARDAETRLQRLLDRTALQFELKPAGTEVRVDDRLVGTSPLQPFTVEPGPHQLALSAPGHEAQSLTLQVDAGATVPVVVTLVPASGAGAAAPPDGRSLDPRGTSAGTAGASEAAAGGEWSKTRLLVAGALAVVALGGGVGAGLLFASGQDLDAEGDRIAGGTYSNAAQAEAARQDAQDRYDQAAGRRTLGWVAAGAGVAALGGLLYVALAKPSAGGSPAAAGAAQAALTPAVPRLALVPEPGRGLSVVLGGTF